MLHFDKRPPYSALAEEDDQHAQSKPLNIEAILGAVRRQWLVVTVCVILSIFVGLAYIVTAVPLYRSQVSILIDRGNSEVVEQFSNMASALDDEPTMLSQVELLKSDSIALAVVDKLKLMDSAEFMAERFSPIAAVKQLFSNPQDSTPDTMRRKAVDELQDNMSVERSGRTYVLQLNYVSASRDLATKIANTFGEVYILDKLNSKYEAVRRASEWLVDRIAELRQKSLDSDLAVQKFRADHGLLTMGDKLVSDQQLSELNSALIVSRSDTAKAQAKLEQVQQIIKSGQIDAIVSDVLGSSVSDDLRKKYLAASKQEADISRRLGPSHIQAIRLRGEMAEYQRLMFDELNRIAQSYQSEYEVALTREKSLTQNVEAATGVSNVAGEAQVQLRELTREADSYRNLYQSFLQRYQEAVQQQSFPITDARMITTAVNADAASFPRKSIVLIVACLLGGLIGAGLGAFREFRDRFFRTGDQVRSVLGLEFLGTIPISAVNEAVADTTSAVKHPDQVFKNNPISNYIVDHPLSSFAETLRSAKIAVDLAIQSDCKIIGIVSTLPGEGKSTVAVNFAELLARQNRKTVLIDCDLRNPGATRSMALHAQAGLLEALIEGRDVHELLLHNPETGLSFLPSITKRRVPHSSELLASPAMRQIITALAKDADYIILDLPPLGAVVDARAIASRVDGFIFVAEWGKTARRVVRQTLDAEPHVREKCLGVILNKVDQDKMKLYNSYGSREYYHSRYTDYYQEG